MKDMMPLILFGAGVLVNWLFMLTKQFLEQKGSPKVYDSRIGQLIASCSELENHYQNLNTELQKLASSVAEHRSNYTSGLASDIRRTVQLVEEQNKKGIEMIAIQAKNEEIALALMKEQLKETKETKTMMTRMQEGISILANRVWKNGKGDNTGN